MKHYSMTILAGALFCVGGVRAQNARFAEGAQAYASIKNNLIQMAEKMPEENYAFKPTPEIRSFGELVAHVAEAQGAICGAVSGQKKPANPAAGAGKAELVSALKESASFCQAAWDSLPDSAATDMVKVFQTQRSKLGVLMMNTIHDNEEYGYMSVYLRLKGIVPPSSAK